MWTKFTRTSRNAPSTRTSRSTAFVTNTGTYGVYVPKENFHLAPEFLRPMPNDWVLPLLPERLASRCVDAMKVDELALRQGSRRRKVCQVRAVGLDKAVWADVANLGLFGDCVWKMVPLHKEKDEDWMVAAFSDNVLLGFVMPVGLPKGERL